MASIRKRVRKDGTASWQVLFREEDGTQSSVTFPTEPEAKALHRALEANGGNFMIAQDVIAPDGKTRTVADVCREHIDLLIKPTPNTLANYTGYLKNHILDSIGGVPIETLSRQQVSAWVRGLMKKRTGPGKTMSPKTVRNVHTFLTSCLKTAVELKYRPDNPASGTDLPDMADVDDDMMYLTLAEFSLVRSHLDEHYRTFATFLVMTGARFGEATALTVGDAALDARPPAVRITKAWKYDAKRGGYYIGPPKSKASKRSVSIPPMLVELLRPVVTGRPSDARLFVDPKGGRVDNHTFYRMYWRPAVDAARAADVTFAKRPKPHHLRHTHTSWLIQEGVDIFKVARRLGHSNVGMIERVYGHLMPDAQVESATAIGRAMLNELGTGEHPALEAPKKKSKKKKRNP